MKDTLQQFWTASRLNTAVRMLSTDRVIPDIIKKASETNITGLYIFHLFMLWNCIGRLEI
jgi:hypothetical protein